VGAAPRRAQKLGRFPRRESESARLAAAVSCARKDYAMIRMLVVCAAAFALAGTAIAQAPPAQRADPRSVRLRGDRFKPLSYDEMTPAQKTMLEHLLAGPRAGANGPFNVLLRSPEIGDLGKKFGASTASKPSLPQKLYKLPIPSPRP